MVTCFSFSIPCVYKSSNQPNRENNIFGKSLDLYPLEIVAHIGDISFKEVVEIQLIDLNNNAPEAKLEFKNVCRTLKTNQGCRVRFKINFISNFISVFSLISVSDKDDCSLGNCAPYTFEIRGPHSMRHSFTVDRYQDYTKCSNETTPFGCYSIRYKGDDQILRTVFQCQLFVG